MKGKPFLSLAIHPSYQAKYRFVVLTGYNLDVYNVVLPDLKDSTIEQAGARGELSRGLSASDRRRACTIANDYRI
jgi:hypothetical protein